MGDRLKGKNAVVTGAGGGIGKEIVLALAAEGVNVVVNDLGGTVVGTGASSSAADAVVAEIKKKGGKAVANYESVTDFDAAGKIIKSCIDNFGRIDILVNVAGVLRDKMCFNMTSEEWDGVIKVHLYGTFNCSRHAIVPMMAQKWGRIISITSDAYRITMGHVNYGAAKGGIVSLMRSMALELATHGITCNCVSPLAATRMTMSEETKQGMKKRADKGIITPEFYEHFLDMPGPQFVPPVVVYLASDYGAKISGCVLGAGGGKISLHSVPDEAHAIYKDYRKQGAFTMDELIRLMPQAIEIHVPPLKALDLGWG